MQGGHHGHSRGAVGCKWRLLHADCWRQPPMPRRLQGHRTDRSNLEAATSDSTKRHIAEAWHTTARGLNAVRTSRAR